MKVQVANLLYIVLFAFVGPALIGVELYGVSLILLIPVMLMGAILEPIWQHKFGVDSNKSDKPEMEWLSLLKIGLYSFVFAFVVFFFYKADFNARLFGSFAASFYLIGVYLLAFYYQAGLHGYIVNTLICNALMFAAVLVTLFGFFDLEYLYLYSFVIAQLLTVLLGVVLLARNTSVSFLFATKKSKPPMKWMFMAGVLKGALRWRLVNIYYFNISLLVLSLIAAPATVGALKYALSFTSAFKFLYPLNVPMLHVAASEGRFDLVRRACLNKYFILQALSCAVLGAVFLFSSNYHVPYFEVDEIIRSLVDNWVVIVLTPIVLVAPSVNSLLIFNGGEKTSSLPVQFIVILAAMLAFLISGSPYILFLPVVMYLFIICYFALLRGVND